MCIIGYNYNTENIDMSNFFIPRRLVISTIIGVLGLGVSHSSIAAVKAVPEMSMKMSLNAGLRPIWTPPNTEVSSNNSDIQDIVRGALKEQKPNYPQLPPFVPDQNYDRTIELVFAIDTTGSMGGLIEGAKQKVWRIINDVTQRQKASNQKVLVRVGLVAYRDVGDNYVTRITPLSSDLDAVYSKLMNFQAEGGGDEPEHVRLAMSDALNATGWSARSNQNDAYGSTNGIGRLSQVLFLVGDAPPHDDYKQYPSVQKTASEAKDRGVIVNAIQVGNIQSTTPIWREVAHKGGGEYFAIAQNGGVQTVSTPYDTRLAELGDDMSRRGVYYGSGRDKVVSEVAGYTTSLAAAPTSARADRAVNKSINTEAAYHSSDLVQAVENKAIDLNKVKTDELPPEMQKMTQTERQVYIQQKIEERAKIRQEITDLSKKREQYLREQGEKTNKSDAFDSAVEKALQKQIK